jgi:two-component system, NtrC family, C4-dicarboxylate transport response regulator DctD
MNGDLVNGPVLLVEDDVTLREATIQTFELSGLEVQPFDSAARAARYVMPSFAGCIVTDIRMDGMDGLQLFAKVMEIDRQIPVVLITGHGDIGMAVRAMQDGAFDFLAKPFAAEHLVAVVRKALDLRQLVLDNRTLRAALAKPEEDIVTESRVMAQLRNMLGQVAQTGLDVSIEGEAGTGKELIARQIHGQSAHYNRPFMVAACTTLGPGTGFDQLVQQAAGGTIFLDGCDMLAAEVQSTLVAFLDARDRARAGSDFGTDFHLIASTPITLAEMVSKGGFREDLFHRLSAVTLRIPPLRERREDIPPLFAKFVGDALAQSGKKRFEMNAADRKRLLEHDWPGNARELRNYAFGAVLNLPRQALSSSSTRRTKDLSSRMRQFEKMAITETLEATSGNVAQACLLLGTPRKTLYEKLAKHQIDPARFRNALSRK